MPTDTPAAAIEADNSADRLPDPRTYYSGPEELLEDVQLDPATRERLLVQWLDELNARLEAESEGMSASDPIPAEEESRMAAELRRVNKALAKTREIVAAQSN